MDKYSKRGPFASLAERSNEYRRDMVALALIFRCARTSDDVWLGCRVHRALSGYGHLGLGEYLSGSAFDAVDSNGEILNLEYLKSAAESFLIRVQGEV